MDFCLIKLFKQVDQIWEEIGPQGTGGNWFGNADGVPFEIDRKVARVGVLPRVTLTWNLIASCTLNVVSLSFSLSVWGSWMGRWAAPGAQSVARTFVTITIYTQRSSRSQTHQFHHS